MPFSSINQLPKQFARLPRGAKKIAMHVVNSMLDTGKSEESAFKGAWSQIEKVFEKAGDLWKKRDGKFADDIEAFLQGPGLFEDFELNIDNAKTDTGIEGAKYIIPIVPMRAMVQEYVDGFALKCYEELEKATPQLEGLPYIMDHPNYVMGKTKKDQKQLGYVTQPEWNDNLKQSEALLVVTADIDLKDLPKPMSIGFDADYDWTDGEYEGQHYDYVQRNIKLDHLAAVEAGRCPYPACGLNTVDNPTADGRTDVRGDKNKGGVKVEAVKDMSLDALADENKSVRKLRELNTDLEKKLKDQEAEAEATKTETETAAEETKTKLEETEKENGELKEKVEKIEEAEKVAEEKAVEENTEALKEVVGEENAEAAEEAAEGKDSKTIKDMVDMALKAKGEVSDNIPTGDKSVKGSVAKSGTIAKAPNKFDKNFPKGGVE